MAKRVWRGRVRDRVRKTFIALDGAIVSTTDLIHRTFPRKQRFHTEDYARFGVRPGDAARAVRVFAALLMIIADAYADWCKHGIEALQTMRKTDPSGYVRVIAGILPDKLDPSSTVRFAK
jgi:hypothetical protein